MSISERTVLNRLRSCAQAAAAQAHVPYSGRPEAAALLLDDGCWVPGVRVESASFSLTISPLLNALTTAAASGRLADIAAVALSHPFRPADVALLRGLEGPSFFGVNTSARVRLDRRPLPALGNRLDAFLGDASPPDEVAGIEMARGVAERAYVPASNFQVGCVLVTRDGQLVPGVNVEPNSAWSHILCAERGALGTAVTYGHADGLRALYLSCPDDPAGSPCGACRQLLVELAPEAVLWMDRDDEAPQSARPDGLLPGFFSGSSLKKPRL